jgi:hypothetical protein
MSTLYVAGDSYATVSNNQESGTSWSEILGKLLNVPLINLSRSAASNVSIAIQIDWIINKCNTDDYVVVLLTDRYRKTLPRTINELDRNNLLLYHSLHKLQLPPPGLVFSKEPILENTLIQRSEYKDFYLKYFNADLQQFEDEYVLTGAFTKLLRKTQKLLVCSGGFDSSMINEELLKVDHETFCLSTDNFIHFSSKKMLRLGASPMSGNHMDIYANNMLAQSFYNKIKQMPM